MRKSIMTLWTVLSIVAIGTVQTASAAAASKQENIGVGTGAVIGAVAGGPVGFFIGAVVGGKLGENMHKKNVQIESLQVSLMDTRDEVSELHTDVHYLNGEITRLEDLSRPEMLALLQAGIDMDLLFRTDEFALTDATGSRLTRLASLLATMPDLNVRLDGFADERGAAEYNLLLSQKRAQFVHDLFVAAGVAPARIEIDAHGESIARDASVDSYALERKVSVKLYVPEASAVANN